MNTKKIIAIIIILILITFFIKAYNEVERMREGFLEDGARSLRDFLNDTFNLKKDEIKILEQPPPPKEDEAVVMYTYKDNVDLSEYVLKTEMPPHPNMNKYILKTKIPGCEDCDEEGKKVKKKASMKMVKKVPRKTKKVKKPVPKKRVKKVNKLEKAVKDVTKPVKDVADTVKKPIVDTGEKIASELDKVVSDPKPVKVDKEAKDKLKRDKDLINKNNVSTLGKNTENGNKVRFDFGKILPDNLTYNKKITSSNRCLHSHVKGTDNDNKVKKEEEGLLVKLDKWFHSLF